MEKKCLSPCQKYFNTNINLLVLICVFCFMSCNDSNEIAYEVEIFQQQVDSILVNVIVPKKDSLQAQIENNEELNQESIDIAYQVIPINTAQFLISSQSDSLSNDLKLFKSNKINANILKEKLDYSKFYVDSILMTNVISY